MNESVTSNARSDTESEMHELRNVHQTYICLIWSCPFGWRWWLIQWDGMQPQTVLTMKGKHTHFMLLDIWLHQLWKQIWSYFLLLRKRNEASYAKKHTYTHPSQATTWNRTEFWFELIEDCPLPLSRLVFYLKLKAKVYYLFCKYVFLSFL